MALSYEEMKKAIRVGINNPPAIDLSRYVQQAKGAAQQYVEYPRYFAWDFAGPESDRTVAWFTAGSPDSFEIISEEPASAPAFPVDHAWDMLVLAAKSSRHE